ncbi:hypothetical protein [Palleronia abyssalis]|uniref:hypothetical protein n=1 Tax=Palleronia abyssalis TaxID=1501240 RepID=UPI000D557834|nr:hypothetical protein [Palleronia abyssalis]
MPLHVLLLGQIGQRSEDVVYRPRILQPHVVAGPQAQQDDVVVVVDDTGDDRSAPELDGFRTGPGLQIVAHGGDAIADGM